MKDRSNDRGFTLLEMLVVVGIIGVVSVIAVPMMANTMANFRVTGDVRSTSNNIALAKMRAASDFSRARLFVDLSSGEHHLQRFTRATATCCWVTEGGETDLSYAVSFGHSVVTSPPPNTQAAIGQAAACKDDAGV